MFSKIENLILLNISISFSKDDSGFKISLSNEEKTEYVVLPYDHLNEFKINKYIDLMSEKLLTNNTTP